VLPQLGGQSNGANLVALPPSSGHCDSDAANYTVGGGADPDRLPFR
jgi:hypothetical protein